MFRALAQGAGLIAPVFTKTLTGDSDAWSNLTMRIVIPHAQFNAAVPRGIPQLARVTFQAGNSEGVQINDAWIGNKALTGDAYDFADAKQLLNEANGTGVMAISAGQQGKMVGSLQYAGAGIVISAFFNSASLFDMQRVLVPATGIDGYFKAANDASTLNATGYTLGNSGAGNIIWGVNGVEMDGF